MTRRSGTPGVVLSVSVALALHQPTAAPSAAAFDSRSFLARFVAGAPHDGSLHGVPGAYDWSTHSLVHAGTNPPRPETTHMDWWGEIYVDSSDYHAPNTRVALANGKLLVLYEGATTWRIVQDTRVIEGGAWTEDFKRQDQPIDMRVEPGGSRSIVPHEGHNAHFWPKVGFYKVEGRLRAVMSIVHTRLILADAKRADDRESSKYLIGLGADWRKPDGSCPIRHTDKGDLPECTGVGHGKETRPTTSWRVVVFHTMSEADLATLPMPPESVFRMPDGTFPSR
jgi:hypothetical protein